MAIFCSFLKHVCRNIDTHVTTPFQCSFYKLVSRPKFPCSSLDFSHDSVFLVATVLLSCFFKLVSRPRFSCLDNISVLVLVATLSCIIIISVVTQKVCRDRVLSPLSLFPCCSFIFLCCNLDFCVRDVLHVGTLICYVVTTLFCMQHIFLSRPSFFSRDITFVPSACLRVTTYISCWDRTFLCSVDFYVAS